MFGYIKPDTPYLFIKDDTLYKALYCGVCKSIGGTCGQVARLSLTYDIAFLSAIAHNISDKDVSVAPSHCIVHPITKKPMAKRDDLSDTLANVNVILAYNKLLDDVYDEKKGRIRSLFLKRAYLKAKKACPVIDEIVVGRYKESFSLEKSGCESVDAAADPFSKMLAEISKEVFGKYATEYTDKLFYYLGKWIYVSDALDDYDKDMKKGDYNVFKSAYKSINAKKLLEENGEDIEFLFRSIFAEIADCVANIKFYFNADLIKNILLRGLPASTSKIIKGIKDDAGKRV